MARPKSYIDWDYVGKRLEAGAFTTSIAASLGIEEDTLRKRCPGDNGCSFSEFRQRKIAKGDDDLREKQHEVAMKGDKVMLVWLGKNRLGQTDKQETTHKVDTSALAKKVVADLIAAGKPEEEARAFAAERYGVLASELIGT